ncbi:MAG TPA: prepilin-type N-terminal cleavage/methylation domain-containing protein [Pirellulales bacterium]
MPRLQPPSRQVRHGFTLVELMLVLGLMVIISALAWPNIQHAYKMIGLKSAAVQVQAAIGHARADAMQTGITQVMRIEQGTPNYTVQPLLDPTAATEGDGSTASSSTISVGAAPGGSGGASQSDGKVTSKELPEGFTFSNSERVQEDSRSVAAENQLSQQDNTNSSLPPLLFYPNGETSESVVTVTSKEGVSISVTLRGLTGTARLGQPFTGDDKANGQPEAKK